MSNLTRVEALTVAQTAIKLVNDFLISNGKNVEKELRVPDDFKVSDVIDKIMNMTTSIENCHNEPSKADIAKQALNEEYKRDIITTLSDYQPRTCTMICSDNEHLSNLTIQKVSALVRQLVIDGKVLKVSAKGGVSMFYIEKPSDETEDLPDSKVAE